MAPLSVGSGAVRVPGAGGVSAAMNEVEADYALNWATNIWSDSLA